MNRIEELKDLVQEARLEAQRDSLVTAPTNFSKDLLAKCTHFEYHTTNNQFKIVLYSKNWLGLPKQTTINYPSITGFNPYTGQIMIMPTPIFTEDILFLRRWFAFV